MPDASGPRGRPARRLAELRAQYLRELPGKASALAEGASRVRQRPQRTSIEALYLRAHRLAGSAGLFGCHAVREPAELLEALLRDVLDGERPHGREFERELDRLVTAVGHGVLAEIGSAPAPRQ